MAADLLTAGAYKPPLPLVEAPIGIYGDATQARAELGQVIIERVVGRLAEVVRAFPASTA